MSTLYDAYLNARPGAVESEHVQTVSVEHGGKTYRINVMSSARFKEWATHA